MSISREDREKLQSLGTTGQGAWLRDFIEQRLEERCDIGNLHTEADLAGAKIVRAILKEDLLTPLSTKREEEKTEDTLVNEFD